MTRVERINNVVDSGLGVIRHAVTATVDTFEECFSAVAIPGADAAVALLAAQNMVQQLGFSLSVAIITGVALEGTGLVTSRAALRCYDYNQTRAPGSPKALAWLAWTLVGLQFGIGCVLVAVNTVAANAMLFGVLTVALLGSIGTLAHVIEAQVKARQSSATIAAATEPVAQPPARERIMAYFVENPHDTSAHAATELSIPPATVSKWRRQLVADGAIPANGDGGR